MFAAAPAALPAIAPTPTPGPAPIPDLTGSVTIGGFVTAIRVIPPGGPVPGEVDSPGRSVLALALSGGYTMTLTETGPSREPVEHWERVEARARFRANGWTFDRATGEIIGPMPGEAPMA